MKKNFAENFQSVQVDPITGEYYITLPESVVNELEWYEDTSVRLTIEGNELIITEDAKND
jgi:hypothetical protein